MAASFNGIILFVSNPVLLQHFYTTHFGMQLVTEADGWILLRAGNGELGLHRAVGMAESSGAISNAKMIFDIAEDIFMLRESLVSKHVNLRQIQTFDEYPYWICDGEDPEGNVFQLRMRKG